MIDFLSKDDELLGVTLEIAQEILDNAPLSIRAAKKLFNEYYKNEKDIFKLQEKAYSTVINSKDKKEAINAFLSKRKPKWEGK